VVTLSWFSIFVLGCWLYLLGETIAQFKSLSLWLRPYEYGRRRNHNIVDRIVLTVKDYSVSANSEWGGAFLSCSKLEEESKNDEEARQYSTLSIEIHSTYFHNNNHHRNTTVLLVLGVLGLHLLSGASAFY